MGADPPPARPHIHDNLQIKEGRIVQQDERNKSMILDIESDSIWLR